MPGPASLRSDSNRLGNCHGDRNPCYGAEAISNGPDTFMAHPIYKIDINTGFDMIGPDGTPVEIKSRKGRALLAMLCLSDDFTQDRSFLLQRLWGSRGAAQAKSSLRQELFGLKGQLNGDTETLATRGQDVRLNPDHVELAPIWAKETLLDWVDVTGEPELDSWLRDIRRSRLLAADAATPNVNIVVGLQRMSSEGSVMSSSISLALESVLMEFLSDVGGVTIVTSYSGHSIVPPDIELIIRCIELGDELRIAMDLRRPDTAQVLSPLVHRMSLDYARNANLPLLVDRLANEAVDHLMVNLAEMPNHVDSPRFQAAKAAVHGVQALFSRLPQAHDEAQKHLNRAVEISASSTHLAWRAYLAALALEESDTNKHKQIKAAALEDIERALAIDPGNGLTAALASQVYGFVLGNFEMASKCLQTAINKRPTHVMTQDAAALYSFYTGDLLTARKAAQKAEYFGRHLPFQYCFSTSLLMVETLAGNFQNGAYHGERARALAPQSGAKPYPPTLRYLGICYAQTGQIEKAEETFGALDALEGRLTRDSLRARASLMPSEDSRALLADSLGKVGR